MNKLRTATLLILGLMVITTSAKGYSHAGLGKYDLRDWTNDVFFTEVSKEKGILLTCSDLRLIQLRSRRPVLLDGGSLDGLPYVLEAGPSMNQILRQVYGVDLLNPSEEIKKVRPGALLQETGKTLWETRSPKQWEEIAKQYGITNVLMLC